MQKYQKMLLGGNGSTEYRKQSTRRGCPTATDAPDTIFRVKMIKNVDLWWSKIVKKPMREEEFCNKAAEK